MVWLSCKPYKHSFNSLIQNDNCLKYLGILQVENKGDMEETGDGLGETQVSQDFSFVHKHLEDPGSAFEKYN